MFNETVQASSRQLAVTRREVFCTVEAEQESQRVNYSNCASDSQERTVRIQPDEKTLPFFVSAFFSDSEITLLLFCDKSLPCHPSRVAASNLLCNWRLKLELLKQSVV